MITTASLRAKSEQVTRAIIDGEHSTAHALAVQLAQDIFSHHGQVRLPYRKIREGVRFVWDDIANGSVCERVKGGYMRDGGELQRADADMGDDLVVVLP